MWPTPILREDPSQVLSSLLVGVDLPPRKVAEQTRGDLVFIISHDPISDGGTARWTITVDLPSNLPRTSGDKRRKPRP